MGVIPNKVWNLYDGRVFRLAKERLRLPNGVTVELEVIRHPGAAAIVPLLGDSTVVMIRQYRHAAGGFLWEIPAGTMNPAERPVECARRELSEEVGYQARSFQVLGEIFPVPGYSDERIHIFLATGLTRGRQKLDTDEVLDVQPIPVEKALEMIKKSEIRDAKTIIGLFFMTLKGREDLHGPNSNRPLRSRTPKTPSVGSLTSSPPSDIVHYDVAKGNQGRGVSR